MRELRTAAQKVAEVSLKPPELKTTAEKVIEAEPPSPFPEFAQPLGRVLAKALGNASQSARERLHPLYLSIDQLCRQIYASAPSVEVKLPIDIARRVSQELLDESEQLWRKWEAALADINAHDWQAANQEQFRLRDLYMKHPDPSKTIPSLADVNLAFLHYRNGIMERFARDAGDRYNAIRIELCFGLEKELETLIRTRLENETAEAAVMGLPLCPSFTTWGLSILLYQIVQCRHLAETLTSNDPAIRLPGCYGCERMPILNILEAVTDQPPGGTSQEREAARIKLLSAPWPKLARTPTPKK